MIKLMRSDLYRLIRGKSLYIYLFLLFLTYFMAAATDSFVAIFLTRNPMDIFEDAPKDMFQLSLSMSCFFFGLIPVYSILVTDLDQKTIKNTLSSACSRRTYFNSKFLLCEAVTGGAFIIVIGFYYTLNCIINSSKPNSVSDPDVFFKAMFTQLPLILAGTAISVAVAVLIKKTVLFNTSIIVTITGYDIILSIFEAFKKTEKLSTEFLQKFEPDIILMKAVFAFRDNNELYFVVGGLLVTAGMYILGLRIMENTEIE